MKLLLDTHTFIWWDISPDKLSSRALALCSDPANQLVLSIASVWEMQIKIQAGKLHFSKPLGQMIREQQETNQIEVFPIVLDHVLSLADLPPLHKDPFDRLLVAQARSEDMTLLSRDPLLTAYPIRVEW